MATSPEIAVNERRPRVLQIDSCGGGCCVGGGGLVFCFLHCSLSSSFFFFMNYEAHLFDINKTIVQTVS